MPYSIENIKLILSIIYINMFIYRSTEKCKENRNIMCIASQVVSNVTALSFTIFILNVLRRQKMWVNLRRSARWSNFPLIYFMSILSPLESYSLALAIRKILDFYSIATDWFSCALVCGAWKRYSSVTVNVQLGCSYSLLAITFLPDTPLKSQWLFNGPENTLW